MARGTRKEVFMFRIERCISGKNRSVGPESVQNKEVFTNRDFTVRSACWKNTPETN